MRRARLLLVACVVVLLVAGLWAASGCGKVKKAAEVARTANDAKDGDFTVKTEEGDVKIETEEGDDDDSGAMTITGPDGKTTMETGKDTVSEADVGIDFYPGAEVQGGSTWATSGEEGGSMSTVALETKDSFDKVAKFYKDRYAKGNTVMEQPEMLMIMMEVGDDAGKTIMVAPADDGDTTTIAITAGGSN